MRDGLTSCGGSGVGSDSSHEGSCSRACRAATPSLIAPPSAGSARFAPPRRAWHWWTHGSGSVFSTDLQRLYRAPAGRPWGALTRSHSCKGMICSRIVFLHPTGAPPLLGLEVPDLRRQGALLGGRASHGR